MLVGLFAPDILFLHEFPLTYFEQITVYRIYFENLVLTFEGKSKFKPNCPQPPFLLCYNGDWELTFAANGKHHIQVHGFEK